MDKDRTRTFKATYTSDNKKVHHLKVKVFKRLAAFGLALTLVHTGLAINNVINEPKEDNHNMNSQDLVLLDKIASSNTIKNIENEDDRTIATLESYFYDYVFKSSVAKISSSKEEADVAGANYYRSLIYGNPKSEADVDPTSIFGRYVILFTGFHDNRETYTYEAKQDYIDKLSVLVKDAEDELNLGGMSNVILPYEDYKSYLEKGNTKVSEENIIN